VLIIGGGEIDYKKVKKSYDNDPLNELNTFGKLRRYK
jgi:hypothetical protein